MCATTNKARERVEFVDYSAAVCCKRSIGTISFAAVPFAFYRGPEFMPLCVVTSPSRPGFGPKLPPAKLWLRTGTLCMSTTYQLFLTTYLINTWPTEQVSY